MQLSLNTGAAPKTAFADDFSAAQANVSIRTDSQSVRPFNVAAGKFDVRMIARLNGVATSRNATGHDLHARMRLRSNCVALRRLELSFSTHLQLQTTIRKHRGASSLDMRAVDFNTRLGACANALFAHELHGSAEMNLGGAARCNRCTLRFNTRLTFHANLTGERRILNGRLGCFELRVRNVQFGGHASLNNHIAGQRRVFNGDVRGLRRRFNDRSMPNTQAVRLKYQYGNSARQFEQPVHDPFRPDP